MGILDKLNAEQYEAVTTVEGPLLVLAGAGSGKTKVIACRIAHLILDHQIPAENILAVTFTNKAAEEMRSRVEQLVVGSGGRFLSPPLISTFHSLCVRILRRYIELLPYPKYTRDFSIYDTDDQARLIRACMNDLNIDQKLLSVKSVQTAISSAKSKGLNWRELEIENSLRREVISQIYKLYQERLERSNALDFDDLLLRTVSLFEQVSKVRDYYNDKFLYILIDEYQDTNPPQFMLTRLLTEKQQNLCVVGDPDQSIYGFRSADIGNILDFERHYPKAKTIKLVQNYRSTKNILDVANQVIKHNRRRREKELRTENDYGERVRYYQASDGEDEANFVAREIAKHVRSAPGVRCAVLYRTNAQSRLFEEALSRLGLRYQIVGGFSFYARAEIKDALAYLRLAVNPKDNVSLERIINTPPRGIGAATIEKIVSCAHAELISYWEAIELLIERNRQSQRAAALARFRELIERLAAATAKMSLADSLKFILSETGYIEMLRLEHTEEAEGRILNLEELVSAAAEADEQGESLASFLDRTALTSDTDRYDPETKVTLMTVHSAKGLEFPVVFLVGLEQGLFPNGRAMSSFAELEEERRLCYVGITRAERYLYLTHAAVRRLYGDVRQSEPSQFLAEMPLDLLEDFSYGDSWLKQRLRKAHRAAIRAQICSSAEEPVKSELGQVSEGEPDQIRKRFSPGTYVRHPKYGYGMVLRREGEGESAKLLVSFSGYGQKKLVEKLADLEKA
ncbi:MAG: UvrD-helicase domain-containing protein [Acidobacteriota bacterium]|nr:UvrD-helicase domain-containing protein [Blastocatellia bacterium]MDW8412517.1 UvrD-helicase domain-containing protein [Acidobacteriota bacterium]